MNLIGLSSIFPVTDICKTAAFYEKKLGFRSLKYLECKEPHTCLYKDNVEIILLQASTDKVYPNRKLYGYGYDGYLYTYDLEETEKQMKEKNVKIVRSLTTTDYQNKELVIEDNDGRWIAFGLKQKD